MVSAERFGDGDELLPIERGGRWGYIDEQAHVRIPLQFRGAERFVGRLARVVTATGPAFVDVEGKVVADGQYAGVSELREGRARVWRDQRYGFLDDAGRIAVELRFDGAYDFANGSAAVKVGDRYGYIDAKGDWLVKPRFEHAWPSSEGLAPVQIDGRIGYVDRGGAQVIPPTWSGFRRFGEGLAAVCRDKRWGFIDRRGETVIDFAFDDADSFSGGLAVVGRLIQPPFLQLRHYYIDSSGHKAFEREFSLAFAHVDGLAAVDTGEPIRTRSGNSHTRCAYINKAGHSVIEELHLAQYVVRFGGAESFKRAVAKVTPFDPDTGAPKLGYIDRTGRLIYFEGLAYPGL